MIDCFDGLVVMVVGVVAPALMTGTLAALIWAARVMALNWPLGPNLAVSLARRHRRALRVRAGANAGLTVNTLLI